MIFNSPDTLVKYLRDGLVEEQHFGYMLVMNKIHVIERAGECGNYPFYLRSCAKPLQASLIVSFGMDEAYNMTEEEIALCCASHAGEQCHIDIAKSLMEKIGINENQLKCGVHAPLSKSAREKMLLDGEEYTTLHNNCSGKHIMMLGLCKLHNWDLETYDMPEHPLQKLIKEHIYQLCELKKEYPVTTDGCGVPIHAMPLENLGKGFLNLFCSKEYEKIKNAFLNNPYIIGGEDRLDTKIMFGAPNCIAKVGAEGLCIVVNTKTHDGFIVKILDSDMKAREFVVLSIINKLGWGHFEINRDIKTLHNDIVGQKVFLIDEL